jgi:hypothetical protein
MPERPIGLDTSEGEGAMWRLSALVALLFVASLFLVAGCASDGGKHWYDEALKDARGDNQQMRGWAALPKGADD